ncbi:MAG: hypothetical protein KF816_16615 [Melioribacteraceae bacterium]|jgi:hypothetical protein|nr:hypothetical protein [Melioribacteraceae bacterium]
MKLRIYFFITALFFVSTLNYAQNKISCTVDGKDFPGKVSSAQLVTIGNDKFIQVHADAGDKIMHLYLKESKLLEQLPVELVYVPRDEEKGESPDAELIWAPDGADAPQWNSIEGKAIVEIYDTANRTVSGSFQFTVEKHTYSSRKDKPRPKAEIENGKFENITFAPELEK